MPDTEASPFLPITAANVQIGMYIKLDCPWFKHPFPRNAFKVQTTTELTLLRGLEHVALYMDPSRSDHHSVQTPRAAYFLTSADPPPVPETAHTEAETAGGLVAKKEEAMHAFLRCQESLKTAQARHAEALRQTKDLIDQVFTSREGCASNTLHMIERVTSALDETGRAMAILNLNNSDEFGLANYTSLHALNVFMVAMMIGREFEVSNADMLSLGVGALLHDIGERKVPSQVLAKHRMGDGWTRAERIFFELHPEYGHRIIEGIGGFSTAAAQAVYQHHERSDGSGYPRGLKEDAISMLAKIVMVADEYDHLTNTLDPSHRLSPTEAFAHLYQKRRQTLPEHVLVGLIHVLGIYPPGTFVLMSDQTLGMVIHSNSDSTTRPTVMIYEADSSAEHGLIVDLMEDLALSIQKVLRPVDVPVSLREYWAARRVAGYFIHLREDSDNSTSRR
jgi:HD-GYP domain-containing protein (c-di-GMP phosphodiesterase class II)